MVDNSYRPHQDCMANRIGVVVGAMQVLVRSNTCRQYDLNILEVKASNQRDWNFMMHLYPDNDISKPSKILPLFQQKK